MAMIQLARPQFGMQSQLLGSESGCNQEVKKAQDATCTRTGYVL